MKCDTCKYALWDYEEYYGTTRREYFIAGCKKDMDGTDCEEYKAESNLDGDPVDIDKAVEHYEKTLETLKGIDLEVDG